MITDESQGSVTARLMCGGLFSCHLIMYLSLSLVIKHFKIGECLAKLQVKKVDCLVCPLHLAMILLKGEELAR